MVRIGMMAALLLSVGFMFPQDVKVPVEKMPDVPEKFQKQLQPLLIRQQKTRLQEGQVAQMYKDLVAQDQQLGQQGLALEQTALKEMKLDPNHFDIDERDGTFVVIEKPNKSEKPVSKP